MKTIPVTVNPSPEHADALAALIPVTHDRKSVDWAYPSSTNAAQFGFPRVGCWILNVEDSTGANLPRALCAFTLREQALATARALPLRWSFAFVHCRPEEKGETVGHNLNARA